MIENKNTFINKIEEKKNNLAVGLGVMSLASVAGIAELPAHLLRDSYLMPPAKVAVVETGESGNGNVNPLQRERSEVGIERVSYSESQRTPARSGRV